MAHAAEVPARHLSFLDVETFLPADAATAERLRSLVPRPASVPVS